MNELREAIELLMQATSNSLDPSVRKVWAHRRDELVDRAKAILP